MKEKTMTLLFKKTDKTTNKSLKNKKISWGGYCQDNPVRRSVLITRVWDKTGCVFFITNLQFIKGVK